MQIEDENGSRILLKATILAVGGIALYILLND